MHLSDTHIAKEENVLNLLNVLQNPQKFPGGKFRAFKSPSYNIDKLSIAINSKIINHTDIDFILITGDIATSGNTADQSIAKSEINKFVNSVKQLKERKNISTQFEIILLPGNHDRFQIDSFKPGGTVFDEQFVHYWHSGQGIQTHIIREKDPFPLGLVLADFSLTKMSDQDIPGGYIGQGKVFKARLKKLVDKTKKLKKDFPNIEILWITHFPPHFKSEKNLFSPLDNTFHKLINDDLLTTHAQKEKVGYILSGHRHISQKYSEKGIQIICAGTVSSYVHDNNSYNYYELETNSTSDLITKHINYVWNKDIDTFVEQIVI